MAALQKQAKNTAKEHATVDKLRKEISEKERERNTLEDGLNGTKPSRTLRNKKLSFRNKMSKTGGLSEMRTLRLLKEKQQKEELKKDKRSLLG